MREVILLITAVLGLVLPARSAEPENLDLHKDALRAYVRTGEYGRDVATVARRAEEWIEQRASRRVPGERLLVVFDLDETLLSTGPYFEAFSFGYSPETWERWVQTEDAPVIAPVRDVYRRARALGLDVIFLSVRPESIRAPTERNLRAIGCAEYAALILPPRDWRGSAEAFKTAQRERLVRGGATIIANLGDQESDLAGGFAERTFKLPGPFYLTK